MTDIPTTTEEKAAAWDAYAEVYSPDTPDIAVGQMVRFMANGGINWRDFMPKPGPKLPHGYELRYDPHTMCWHLYSSGVRVHTWVKELPEDVVRRKAAEVARAREARLQDRWDAIQAELPRGYLVVDLGIHGIGVLTPGQPALEAPAITSHYASVAVERARLHAARSKSGLYVSDKPVEGWQPCEDIVIGGDPRYVRVEVPSPPAACPECNGTGEWAGLSGMPMHTCRTCGGKGHLGLVAQAQGGAGDE